MKEIPASILDPIFRAAKMGTGDGTRSAQQYVQRCTHFHGHTGTLIVFTRDVGHHSSGWLKNPDFERCRHLSLSFREPQPDWPVEHLSSLNRLVRLGGVFGLAPFDMPLARRWVDMILGADARYAWTESAKSPQGEMLGVMHWRVFCDANWEAIMPRGEVYSKEFTPLGWRSWSDIGQERPSHIDAD